MTNAIHRMVAAGAALEVRHHGALDLGPVVAVHHLLHVDDKVGETVATVTEQAIKIGVVGVAALDVPVPQADVRGIQRQLQTLAGGTEFGVGGFQQTRALLDNGFEAVVGFLQMLLGLLALEDLAGQFLVQGFGVAARAIQVVDQRQVLVLQGEGLHATAVHADAGQQDKQRDAGEHRREYRAVAAAVEQYMQGHRCGQGNDVADDGRQVDGVAGDGNDGQAEQHAAEQGLVRHQVGRDDGRCRVQVNHDHAHHRCADPDQQGRAPTPVVEVRAFTGKMAKQQARYPAHEGAGGDQAAAGDQLDPGNAAVPVQPHDQQGTGRFEQVHDREGSKQPTRLLREQLVVCRT